MLGLSFTIAASHSCIISIQTDVIAVQRVYYNQTNNFSCKYHSFNGRLHGDSQSQFILRILSHFTRANSVVVVAPVYLPSPGRFSTALFIRTHPNTQLNNDLIRCRPMDVGNVHAAARVFRRWYFAAVPRPTPLDEYGSCILGKHLTYERLF